MSQSITVKSCKLKKETDTFKVYGVEDMEGNKYDAFKLLEEGKTYQVEITPNGNYAPKLKVIEDRKNGFPAKDYTFDKKRVALECTVSLIASGHLDIKQLDACREKFFNYLNQK